LKVVNVGALTMPIPLRADIDAAGVRVAARRAKDGAQARRLLALAAIADGASRTEAARIGGVIPAAADADSHVN
jgi:hypothetical protein